MTWFRRARARHRVKGEALLNARQQARDLGKETAELIAPKILNPAFDPAVVRDFCLSIVGAANLKPTFPDLDTKGLRLVHADFARAFWNSVIEQTENLK